MAPREYIPSDRYPHGVFCDLCRQHFETIAALLTHEKGYGHQHVVRNREAKKSMFSIARAQAGTAASSGTKRPRERDLGGGLVVRNDGMSKKTSTKKMKTAGGFLPTGTTADEDVSNATASTATVPAETFPTETKSDNVNDGENKPTKLRSGFIPHNFKPLPLKPKVEKQKNKKNGGRKKFFNIGDVLRSPSPLPDDYVVPPERPPVIRRYPDGEGGFKVCVIPFAEAAKMGLITI